MGQKMESNCYDEIPVFTEDERLIGFLDILTRQVQNRWYLVTVKGKITSIPNIKSKIKPDPRIKLKPVATSIQQKNISCLTKTP